MSAVALLPVLLLLSAPSPVDELAPGQTVLGKLEAGEARYELRLGAPEPLTLSVESFQFDPMVTVTMGGEGRGEMADGVVGEDRSSGTGTGAWLGIEAKAAATHRIVVRSEDGDDGHFLLTVHRGRLPPPDESELDALERVYGRMAEIEQSRGRRPQARELNDLAGRNLFNRVEYARAIPFLRMSLQLAVELDDVANQVLSAGFLGAAETKVGTVEVGIDLLEKAYEQRRALGAANFDCFVLQNLGDAYFARGEYERALERQAAMRDRAREAGILPFEAFARSRAATTLELLGDIPAARAEHETALALLERFEEPSIEAQVLLGAGQFHEHRKAYDRSGELYEAALQFPVAWDIELALRLQLGNVHAARGRYGEARTCLDMARTLTRDRQDARFDLPLRIAMTGLALDMGDLHEALRLTNESLTEAEARNDLTLQIQILADRGLCQERLGEFDAAERTYEVALGLCGASGDAELEGRVLFNQARLLTERGRYSEALSLHEAVLGIAEAANDDDGRASALAGIAWSRFLLHQYDEARPFAREAVEIREAAGELDHALYALHTLARISVALGELDEARRLVDRADDIIEREHVRDLEPMIAAGVRSMFVAWGEVAQDIVARKVGASDRDTTALVLEGFREAARWKARALLEGLPQAGGPLELVSPLRNALGEDRVLIDFAWGSDRLYAYVLDADRLRFVDLGPASDLEEELRRFQTGMTDFEDLAPAEAIAREGSALYLRLLEPIVASLDDGIAGLVVVPTPSLARLPFEALVMGADAGDDGLLSFSDMTFVGDRFHVTYGPSTPVLARLAALGPRREPGRVLVVGDPVYAAESSRQEPTIALASTLPVYERLEETKDEVVEIAEVLLLSQPADDPTVRHDLAELARLKRERSGKLESKWFDLYFGKEATAGKLRRDLSDYSMLHIAAHGEVDVADPLRSGLVLAFDGRAHGYLTIVDILDLSLDANLVVLSACDTARGRVLKGEGVQSMATAVLQAGSRAVLASLWSVEDRATRSTMAGFYESYLLEGQGRAEALRDAKALRAIKMSIRHHGVARGSPLGDPLAPRTSRSSDVGHPYYWAPFIYIGAIP